MDRFQVFVLLFTLNTSQSSLHRQASLQQEFEMQARSPFLNINNPLRQLKKKVSWFRFSEIQKLNFLYLSDDDTVPV